MINLDNKLKELRDIRNFNVKDYVEKKCIAINNFFNDNNLDSAVLGISGGIDSAIVLGLLCRASTFDNSPIKKIMAITLPIYSKGSTEQDDTLIKANLLFDVIKYKVESKIIDLSNTCKSYVNAFDSFNTPFSEGQLLSIVRTPALYYQAALLQDNGYKSIVVGTTNRDEGSYIGFFGKFSDGANDLQPIADIHKSEVYKVAEFLGIPDIIINAIPKGNVYDGKTDEEMIGASYDMIELFILSLDYNYHIDFLNIEKKYFDAFSNIQKIHLKNLHKYKKVNNTIEPLGYSKYIDVISRIIYK